MKVAFSRSEPLDTAIKTALWGVAWLAGAATFWLGVVGNPINDLRLALYATTVQGKILAVSEEPEDQDGGGVRWSSAIAYSFVLVEGREIESGWRGEGRIPVEWAEDKLPVAVEVEYLPSDPSVNRLKVIGSHTAWEWVWRTAVGLFLLWLFAFPGVQMLRGTAGLIRRGYDEKDAPISWPTGACPIAHAAIVEAKQEAARAGLTVTEALEPIAKKMRIFAIAHVPDCAICLENRESVRRVNRTGMS